MGDVFRALADPTRREVLRLLRQGPLSAGAISERFTQNRSTLSAHLSALKAAALVRTERHGQTIVYSLNVSILEETVAAVLDVCGPAHPLPAANHAAPSRSRRSKKRKGPIWKPA